MTIATTPTLIDHMALDPQPCSSLTISCFHNTPSDFHLELVQKGKDGNGNPYIYYAIGAFPHAQEGAVDFFAVAALSGDNSIATAAAKHYGNRSLIMVAAASSYVELNGTQYGVSFTPTSFTVEVDVIGKLINVSPMNTAKVDCGVVIGGKSTRDRAP